MKSFSVKIFKSIHHAQLNAHLNPIHQLVTHVDFFITIILLITNSRRIKSWKKKRNILLRHSTLNNYSPVVFTIVHLWSRWMLRWHVYLAWARTTCRCWHRNCRHVSAAGASSSWASRSEPRSFRNGPLAGMGLSPGVSPPGSGSLLQGNRSDGRANWSALVNPCGTGMRFLFELLLWTLHSINLIWYSLQAIHKHLDSYTGTCGPFFSRWPESFQCPSESSFGPLLC